MFRKYFDPKLVKLWFMYEWQSVEKLVLTEGEKFVLWFSASLVDQGIYSVVNNLGTNLYTLYQSNVLMIRFVGCSIFVSACGGDMLFSVFKVVGKL